MKATVMNDEMPNETVNLLMEYTRQSKADVMRFIGAAEACGYKLTRTDLANPEKVDETELEQMKVFYEELCNPQSGSLYGSNHDYYGGYAVKLVKRLVEREISLASRGLLSGVARENTSTGWRDIESAPYDEMALFYTVDGNVVQGFIYDGGPEDFGYTHWMPLPQPPAEANEDENA